MPYVLQAKQVFCTWPALDFIEYPESCYWDWTALSEPAHFQSFSQWIHDKCMQNLSGNTTTSIIPGVPDVEWVIATGETHQDGTPHAHVAIKFINRLRTSNPHLLDPVMGKHGSYETLRSIHQTVKYFQDKPADRGGQPVSANLDLTSIRARKSPKGDTIAIRLINGDKVGDIMRDEPGYTMLHLPRIKEFCDLVAQVNDSELEDVEPNPGMDLKWVDDENVQEFYGNELDTLKAWLDTNFFMILPRPKSRPIRSKQLWLCGDTGTGKNRLIAYLERYYPSYQVCLDDVWYEDYSDREGQFIWIDEFHGQRTIAQLNSLLAGTPCKLKRRGRAPYTKTENCPVIILSNKRPEDVFHKAHAKTLQALLDRVTVIELEAEFIPINF